VIHSRHLSLLDHAMFFWQILLRECNLVTAVSQLLSHELGHPIIRLVAVFRHEAWDYERHCCGKAGVVRWISGIWKLVVIFAVRCMILCSCFADLGAAARVIEGDGRF